MFLLPKLLLTAPKGIKKGIGGRNALLRHLSQRAARFNRGEWAELIAEAESEWPLQKNDKLDTEIAEQYKIEEVKKKRADKVIATAAEGSLSKAIRIMMSQGVAPPTKQTAGILRSLLNTMPTANRLQMEETQQWRETGEEISEGYIKRTIQELTRGSAFDLNGWCTEHIQLLLASATALTAFEGFIQMLRTSRLSSEAYDNMAIAKPTPLIKARRGS